MRYRQLGSSELEVSEIALGSWLTYGVSVPREQAKACLAAAFDAGITLFDTANVYGEGRAEELLGDALAGRPRESYVLATKLYFPVRPRRLVPGWAARRSPLPALRPERGLSRAQVHAQIDRSLRRLRTEYVDLYQCHRYDWETPLEETMEALSEVVRQGKVRYIGFSEWPVEKVREAQELAGVERFVSSQPQYSLLWRGPERELIPYCAAQGISQIVWSPLAQGVLTGKYPPGAPAPTGSRATSTSGRFMPAVRDEEVLRRVERLAALAAELGMTAPQLALAWVLRESNVAAAIVGASRPDQVSENASASGVVLDEETLRQIDEIVADVVAWEGPASGR